MPTLIPTYDKNATSMSIGMTTTLPDRTVTEQALDSTASLGDLDAPFVLGQLSMMLTHERCGRHLYRSCASRSMNPILKGKYEEFGGETERHVELLEQLITAVGGNPCYVSPAARATEKADSGLVESTFVLGGSCDMMTAEAMMLDAVFIAESVDHANWQYMSKLVPELPSGDIRDLAQRITAEVEAQEDEHLSWSHDMRARLAMMQTKSSFAMRSSMKAEELVARVKSMFDGG
jgi:hypothetical protein